MLSAGALAACGRAERRGTVISSADSVLLPERRVRFYRDPDSDEAAMTLVVSLKQGGAERFILAQTGMGDGPLSVVSDSAGLIPVFASEAEARAYIARYFPLDTSGAHESDSIVAAYAEMLGKNGPIRMDFDAALAWSDDPAKRSAGPMTLAGTWELLSAADAAPPMAAYDPMYLPFVMEEVERGGADSLHSQLRLVGMLLNALLSEGRRGGAEDSWPAQLDSIWTSRQDELLARILRTGIASVVSRLSPEAATRDVSQTWPAPAAPNMSASFPGGESTMTVQLLIPTAASPSDDEQRRTVRMRLVFHNDGDRPARGLEARVRVPAGLAVLAGSSGPQRIARDPNGGTTVEYSVVSVPGRSEGEAGEIVVRFPDWRSVQPFDLEVEILTDGVAAARSRLHVEAAARLQ